MGRCEYHTGERRRKQNRAQPNVSETPQAVGNRNMELNYENRSLKDLLDRHEKVIKEQRLIIMQFQETMQLHGLDIPCSLLERVQELNLDARRPLLPDTIDSLVQETSGLGTKGSVEDSGNLMNPISLASLACTIQTSE